MTLQVHCLTNPVLRKQIHQTLRRWLEDAIFDLKQVSEAPVSQSNPPVALHVVDPMTNGNDKENS